jgi:hypothetical protein
MREVPNLAKKEERTLAEFEINFPKAPKKVKEREVLFNKFFSLIEDGRESLPVKVKSHKRGRQIILDSDEFMFSISFGKTVSTKILVNAPEKNIDVVNEVGNKVINYMNTILGEKATNSHVILSKTILRPQKAVNLCKKLIGEPTLAKINETVKQTLNPVGIFFEYEFKEKYIAFSTLSNEKSAEGFFSRSVYKDKIPFDLLRKEYDMLVSPAEIVKKLIEMEL